MKILWAFLWRDILIETGYTLSFWLRVIGVFPAIIMFFFLSRLIPDTPSGPLQTYGSDYFSFVLIGIALQNYLSLSLSGFARHIRESQLTGTLEAVLVTPVRLPVFLFGSTAYNFLFNTIFILVYLVVGSMVFGAEIRWEQSVSTIPVLMLTIAAFSGIGILSACFILLFKKGDPLNWIFSTVSWLLSGVYYPVSVMPEWLQAMARLIPTTHALEALRHSLLKGEAVSGFNLSALALWALLGLPLSLLCFRYALNKARNKGTLGHY